MKGEKDPRGRNVREGVRAGCERAAGPVTNKALVAAVKTFVDGMSGVRGVVAAQVLRDSSRLR